MARTAARPTPLLLALMGLAACAGAGQESPDKDTSGGDTGSVPLEEGCITVDGEGGYAWINDALSVAVSGSVIELCPSEGHEEAVSVDKDVTILGPGIDQFILIAPTNTAGITVSAGNLTLSGLQIQSTRSGVEVKAGAGLMASDLMVSAAGNWGVSAVDANVAIAQSVFTSNGYGGVKVEGGQASIENSTFDLNVAYGIYGTEGTQISVAGVSVSNTLPNDPEAPEDGVGALVEGSSVLSSSASNPSTWTDNFLVNIWADEADLDLHGDTIDGGYYSVVNILGEALLEGVTATDGYNYGLFIITPEPVSVIDSTVTGTAPENTVEIADGRWGVEDSSGNVNYAGTAMYLVSDELTVSGGMATGYNNNGLLVAPYNEAGTALLSGLQLVNLGRKGAYIIASDTTAEGLVISGITEVEDTGDNRCLTVDSYGGFITIQANVQWSGGSVSEVEGYGISGIASTLTVQDGTFSSNWCSALMNFQGALVASANSFSAPGVEQSGLSASVVNYLGAAPSVISGNTFTDSATEYEDYQYYTYNDGTTDYLYEWYYRFVGGFDMYNYGSEVDVIDNTFSNGTVSLSYYSASGTVSGNTWTNYGSTVLDVVDSTVVAEDLVVDGFAGPAISCSQGSLELDNVNISNGGLYTYEYDFYYNGEFQYTTTSSSPGQGIATYDCSLTARDITMSSLPSSAWYAYSYGDNVFELDGWELSGVNEDPTYAYYPVMNLVLYSADTTLSTSDTVYLTDISMTGIGSNSGIQLYSPYYASSALAVWAEDITIDAPPQYGLYLAGTSGTQNLTGSLTSISVVDAGTTGIYLANADMDLDTVLVDGSGSEGLSLNQVSTNLNTLSSNSNATYGLSCVSATVESCAEIDLQGNGLGEMSACSLPCETEASDTGDM